MRWLMLKPVRGLQEKYYNLIVMRKTMVNKNEVVSLIEKIDKKKKELKQLRKKLHTAFNDISNLWKEESAKQFPQLSPCNIGEYVGVDLIIKDKVYNVFISESGQKLYCMFSFDRKDKSTYSLNIRTNMDKDSHGKLTQFINDYLDQHNKHVWSNSSGYYVRFEKEQYEDAFLYYLDLVSTFVLSHSNNTQTTTQTC